MQTMDIDGTYVVLDVAALLLLGDQLTSVAKTIGQDVETTAELAVAVAKAH